MKNTHVYIFGIVLSVLAIGCSKTPDTKKVSPSSIENPVKESDLTTIKLTDKAVERLGIKTKEIEALPMKLTRIYSGEVMAVPGQSMTLTAPVSGTILGMKNGALPMAGTAVKKGQPLYRLLILPSERPDQRAGRCQVKKSAV